MAVLKAHLIERVSLFEMEGPACDGQMVDLILGFSHFEMEGPACDAQMAGLILGFLHIMEGINSLTSQNLCITNS